MGLQELLPCRLLLPLGCRLNPVLPEDGGDGPASDVVAHVAERALNPRVTPVAILRRHAHDQLANLCCQWWPSRPAQLSPRTIRTFLHELSSHRCLQRSRGCLSL